MGFWERHIYKVGRVDKRLIEKEIQHQPKKMAKGSQGVTGGRCEVRRKVMPPYVCRTRYG